MTNDELQHLVRCLVATFQVTLCLHPTHSGHAKLILNFGYNDMGTIASVVFAEWDDPPPPPPPLHPTPP